MLYCISVRKRLLADEPSLFLLLKEIFIMSKSESHKKAQNKAAGKNGYTEYQLKNGKKLDAMSANKKRATEVERNGNFSDATKRLKASGASQKVLQVPQKDMKRAEQAMKESGVNGTVKNMSGTKRKSV